MVLVPPFDAGRAHELYEALFGQVESVIRGKQLIIVSSGALTSLPLQVLVTEKPQHRLAQTVEDLASVKWLGKRQAISVLPAVSSLKTLRHDVKKSAAAKPYIGFGNPKLNGAPEDQQARENAERNKTCTEARMNSCKKPFTISGAPPRDWIDLRSWPPLPQTACELCTIASELKVAEPDSDVWLSDRATETEVKTLGAPPKGSSRSPLQDYKIVHFATHGSTADPESHFAEPGLVLSPPEKGQESENDDGYLSASEIAGLKLDADWVILSACETAAGTRENGEELSGLARAFFYAGARAILVSHWEMYTDAGVELTTGTFNALDNDKSKSLGRAEAMRSAINAIFVGPARDDDVLRLHPSYWGAFSIVGEGGK